MKCPRCQQENPPQAKFCPECATPLAPGCVNCGHQLPPAAKFCPECAHPVDGSAAATQRFGSPDSYTPKHLAERILTSKAALQGERKQVTVLFADVKGSMELLADRDPEEARKIREGEQLLERQAARGITGNLGLAYHSLGRAAMLLGQLDEARRLADRAVESSPHHPGFAAHAQHLLGDIATHPDRFDAEIGEAHYRQALALAEPRRMLPLVAHCHVGLGKLYRRAGKRRETQEHLTSATTMYREMDMRFWLEQAEAATKEGAP